MPENTAAFGGEAVLGPVVETFKPNKFAVALAGVLTLSGFLAWFYDLFGLVTGALISAPLLAWLRSVRVELHQDGISYRSLFGSKQMRWDQMERFTYAASKYRVQWIIPIGTYYYFKLVDVFGNKVSFGNRIERPAELGRKLVEYTYAPLFNKAADLFNSGVELDFGAIRMSKDQGLKVKKTFRWKQIPWQEIAGYKIEEGHFYIWCTGQKYATGSPLREVPNAFVLAGLLDALYKPKDQAVSGT